MSSLTATLGSVMRIPFSQDGYTPPVLRTSSLSSPGRREDAFLRNGNFSFWVGESILEYNKNTGRFTAMIEPSVLELSLEVPSAERLVNLVRIGGEVYVFIQKDALERVIQAPKMGVMSFAEWLATNRYQHKGLLDIGTVHASVDTAFITEKFGHRLYAVDKNMEAPENTRLTVAVPHGPVWVTPESLMIDDSSNGQHFLVKTSSLYTPYKAGRFVVSLERDLTIHRKKLVGRVHDGGILKNIHRLAGPYSEDEPALGVTLYRL